jgi:hypothetical protein
MINPGYRRAVAVSPSDTDHQNFGFTQKALYIGTTGHVKITTPNGDTVVFNSVPVGMLYVTVDRVWSNGTTASNIVALGD